VKGISFAGIVESLRSRKDKTIAITIGSQELEPAKAGQLFDTNGHLVYCYLSIKGAVTDDEAEIIDSVEVQTPNKRPSQRMFGFYIECGSKIIRLHRS
jgi:hypothetical protein